MTFDEYSKMPNKQWWQVTDQGYWDAGFAAGVFSRDAEIAELVGALEKYRGVYGGTENMELVADITLAKVRKPLDDSGITAEVFRP